MYFAKDAARFAAEVALASQTGGIHKKKKKIWKFLQNLRNWERSNGMWEVITEKVLSKTQFNLKILEHDKCAKETYTLFPIR